MNETKPFCFVIMPFAPELHYLYLYLKHHVESKHGLRCERADERFRTIPVIEKIDRLIQEADVIIADCSGRNANVFYERGLSHAHGKPVILITKDSVQEAPSDIRHFEFIHYEIEKHVAFLERLDNALHHALFEAYKPLYGQAHDILNRFIKVTDCRVRAANEEVFLRRVKDAERARGIPTGEEQAAFIKFLLPKIVEDSTDADIMKAIVLWTSGQGSSTAGS